MQCSVPRPHTRSTAVDADDFAVGKQLGEDAERDAVVGVVEGGHQHEAVGDVEVCIAGRQALAAEDDGARQGQFDDGELLSVERARGFEAGKIFGQRLRGWRRLCRARRR